MPYQNIGNIKAEARSQSINKWAKIISKEVGIDIKGIKGTPTERMLYVIEQLKRKKNLSRGEWKKIKKLRKKRKKG